MTARRSVRVADSFFAALDDQLGPDRSVADGAPSATDFLVFELPPVVERFATDVDGLPEVIEGLPGARLLIASGRPARAIVISSDPDDPRTSSRTSSPGSPPAQRPARIRRA